MLPELLPLLRGWTYKSYDLDNLFEKVKAGGEKELIRTEKPGWIGSGGVLVDNKNAHVILETWDVEGVVRRVEVSPWGMYHYGAVSWTPTRPYLAKYDETNNIYTVEISPLPWIPYQRGRLRVKSPPDSDVTIISWHACLVEITDVEEFKRSLQEALYGVGLVRAPYGVGLVRAPVEVKDNFTNLRGNRLREDC